MLALHDTLAPSKSRVDELLRQDPHASQDYQVYEVGLGKSYVYFTSPHNRFGCIQAPLSFLGNCLIFRRATRDGFENRGRQCRFPQLSQ